MVENVYALPPPTPIADEYISIPSYRYQSGNIALGEILRTAGESTELTEKLVESMLLDSAVLSAVTTLHDGLFQEPLLIRPAYNGRTLEKDAPEFEAAKAISDFVQRVICHERLEQGIEETVFEAIVYGACLAELVWEIEGDGEDAGRIVVKRIKAKPRNAVRFVVDRFLNLLGFVDTKWGVGTNVAEELIVPREKGLVIAIRPRKSDPRGTSVLKAARVPWEAKMNAFPELQRMLSNLAQPPLVGKLPREEAAKPARDQNGQTITAAQKLALTLAGLWEPGKHTIVVPAGAEIEPIPIPANPANFESAIELHNREITQAILHQTRATREAQHGSKADSNTGATILEKVVHSLKVSVCRSIREDVVRHLVAWNFGPAAEVFIPRVTLGDSDRADWSTDATAAAALGYKLHPTQFAEMDEVLNLKPRDPEAIAAYDAEQADLLARRSNLYTGANDGQSGI